MGIEVIKIAWTLITRLVWIWRPVYKVVDLERIKKDAPNLTVFIAAENGYLSDHDVSHVWMRAEYPLDRSWTAAEYVPVDNDNAMFVIPRGHRSQHQVELCLASSLDHRGQPAFEIPPERIARDIITHNPRLTFRLMTSEGDVILTGNTDKRPIANEHIPLLRRLRRVAGI